MSTATLAMSELQLPVSRNYKAEATARTPIWTHIKVQVVYTLAVVILAVIITTEPRMIEILMYQMPFQILPVAIVGGVIFLWWQAAVNYQEARLKTLRGLVVDHLWEEAQKAKNSLKVSEFEVADYLVQHYFVGTYTSQAWTKTKEMRKELLEAFENIEDEAILAPILRWKRSDTEREKLVAEYYAHCLPYFQRLRIVQEDLSSLLRHASRIMAAGKEASSN